MSRKASLYFIRHAEGFHNIHIRTLTDERFKDAYLTENGIQQSKNLQPFLSNINIDFITSSPLSRCLQTMNFSLIKYNKPIVVDDMLIERQGDIANVRKNKYELQKLTDKLLNLEKVGETVPMVYNIGVNLESNNDMLIRAKKWLDNITAYIYNNNLKTVVIYSHSEFLYVLFTNIFKQDGSFYNAQCKEIIITFD